MLLFLQIPNEDIKVLDFAVHHIAVHHIASLRWEFLGKYGYVSYHYVYFSYFPVQEMHSRGPLSSRRYTPPV
jgi:hypothetical protein